MEIIHHRVTEDTEAKGLSCLWRIGISRFSIRNFSLRALCLVYCSQVLFLKKPAENYYVREWATIKLVGAHDNFSAGYKQLYCAF